MRGVQTNTDFKYVFPTPQLRDLQHSVILAGYLTDNRNFKGPLFVLVATREGNPIDYYGREVVRLSECSASDLKVYELSRNATPHHITMWTQFDDCPEVNVVKNAQVIYQEMGLDRMKEVLRHKRNSLPPTAIVYFMVEAGPEPHNASFSWLIPEMDRVIYIPGPDARQRSLYIRTVVGHLAAALSRTLVVKGWGEDAKVKFLVDATEGNTYAEINGYLTGLAIAMAEDHKTFYLDSDQEHELGVTGVVDAPPIPAFTPDTAIDCLSRDGHINQTDTRNYDQEIQALLSKRGSLKRQWIQNSRRKVTSDPPATQASPKKRKMEAETGH